MHDKEIVHHVRVLLLSTEVLCVHACCWLGVASNYSSGSDHCMLKPQREHTTCAYALIEAQSLTTAYADACLKAQALTVAAGADRMLLQSTSANPTRLFLLSYCRTRNRSSSRQKADLKIICKVLANAATPILMRAGSLQYTLKK